MNPLFLDRLNGERISNDIPFVFIMKPDTKLSFSEKRLIDKMNEVLSLCGTNDYKTTLYRFSKLLRREVVVNQTMPRIEILSTVVPSVDFPNIQEYRVFPLQEKANIPFEEFQRFVQDQHVPFLFRCDFHSPLEKMEDGDIYELFPIEVRDYNSKAWYTDAKLLCDADYEALLDLIWAEIAEDVRIANGLIDKLDPHAASGVIYCCIHGGYKLVAEKRNTYHLNTELFLALLCLSNLEKIFNALHREEEKRNRELETMKLQREAQIKQQLIDLENTLRQDEIFLNCTSAKKRFQYFKDTIKNYYEDLLSYFNLTVASNGSIRANDASAELYMNQILQTISK